MILKAYAISIQSRLVRAAVLDLPVVLTVTVQMEFAPPMAAASFARKNVAQPPIAPLDTSAQTVFAPVATVVEPQRVKPGLVRRVATPVAV